MHRERRTMFISTVPHGRVDGRFSERLHHLVHVEGGLYPFSTRPILRRILLQLHTRLRSGIVS